MPEPVTLVTTKSDAEIAADLRVDILGAFEPVVKIIQRAKDAGFMLNFQVGPGPLGRIALLNVTIAKEF